MTTSDGDEEDPGLAELGDSSSRPFRFKRKHEHERTREESGEPTRRRHRHHRHHHRRHKRRRLSEEPPSTDQSSNLPPDVAFRESLFDALGDDEGADFWQGVYGQPIHNYPRTYADADTGELGTMDDEQYAQYVRRRMWEKSAEGIQAAKEAKSQDRREREDRRRQEHEQGSKQETRPLDEQDFVFDLEIDASLKRGETRKETKRWRRIWEDYRQHWDELQRIYESRRGSSADNTEQIFLRNKIAWPVESGKKKDVEPDKIEQFYAKVTRARHDEHSDHETATISILKSERVKWHPDKIQQKYGFMQIEPATMETVTAVFQVIDRLWNDRRGRVS